jgi:hypothetical protein
MKHLLKIIPVLIFIYSNGQVTKYDDLDMFNLVGINQKENNNGRYILFENVDSNSMVLTFINPKLKYKFETKKVQWRITKFDSHFLVLSNGIRDYRCHFVDSAIHTDSKIIKLKSCLSNFDNSTSVTNLQIVEKTNSGIIITAYISVKENISIDLLMHGFVPTKYEKKEVDEFKVTSDSFYWLTSSFTRDGVLERSRTYASELNGKDINSQFWPYLVGLYPSDM